jgi:hypothetical protein
MTLIHIIRRHDPAHLAREAAGLAALCVIIAATLYLPVLA